MAERVGSQLLEQRENDLRGVLGRRPAARQPQERFQLLQILDDGIERDRQIGPDGRSAARDTSLTEVDQGTEVPVRAFTTPMREPLAHRLQLGSIRAANDTVDRCHSEGLLELDMNFNEEGSQATLALNFVRCHRRQFVARPHPVILHMPKRNAGAAGMESMRLRPPNGPVAGKKLTACQVAARTACAHRNGPRHSLSDQ
jgi:hypothetical protein